MANVLIACEYSGAVRRAFAAKGHTVTSIDLLPSDDDVGAEWDYTLEGPQRHLVGDVLEHLAELPGHYDMLIGFPPCTNRLRVVLASVEHTEPVPWIPIRLALQAQ